MTFMRRAVLRAANAGLLVCALAMTPVLASAEGRAAETAAVGAPVIARDPAFRDGPKQSLIRAGLLRPMSFDGGLAMTSSPVSLYYGRAVTSSAVSLDDGRVMTEQTAEPAAPRQTQADDYTRYELLDPASASFRILYEVTATTPGARYYWNPIRKGSIASNESVSDPASGLPLKFTEVSGAEAKANGLGTADLETRYIQIELPRPVPKEGEIRLLIDKTYKDEKSYFVEEKTGFIVFSRSLGIKRNSVVLPAGYEVVACSYPSQVFPEIVAGAAGSPPRTRLRLSFMNIGPDAASYVVKARRTK